MSTHQPPSGREPEKVSVDELIERTLGKQMLNQANRAKIFLDSGEGEGLVVWLKPRTTRRIKAVVAALALAVGGCAGFTQIKEPPQSVERSTTEGPQGGQLPPRCDE